MIYRADPSTAGLDPTRLLRTSLVDFGGAYKVLAGVYSLFSLEERLGLLEALEEARLWKTRRPPESCAKPG